MTGYRKPENADLPKHLYPRGDRWIYRGCKPTRTFRGTRSEAIRWAGRIAASQPDVNKALVHVQIDRYLERARLELKPSTVKGREQVADRVKRWVGPHYTMKSVTREVLAAMWEAKGLSPHTVALHRAFWIGVFTRAVAAGVCDINEAELTERPIIPPRKRERLTLEMYDAIYCRVREPVQIAMEIALCSMLRLGDLENAKLADIEGGSWTVTHGKTGKGVVIQIPAGSRLDKAVKRARAYPIHTPYLIPWRPLLGPPRKALSRKFTRAAKELGSTATWHEIKSLGQHLYEQRYGVAHAIALAQWSDTKMAEHYRAGRELPVVEAGL